MGGLGNTPFMGWGRVLFRRELGEKVRVLPGERGGKGGRFDSVLRGILAREVVAK